MAAPALLSPLAGIPHCIPDIRVLTPRAHTVEFDLQATEQGAKAYAMYGIDERGAYLMDESGLFDSAIRPMIAPAVAPAMIALRAAFEADTFFVRLKVPMTGEVPVSRMIPPPPAGLARRVRVGSFAFLPRSTENAIRTVVDIDCERDDVVVRVTDRATDSSIVPPVQAAKAKSLDTACAALISWRKAAEDGLCGIRMLSPMWIVAPQSAHEMATLAAEAAQD